MTLAEVVPRWPDRFWGWPLLFDPLATPLALTRSTCLSLFVTPMCIQYKMVMTTGSYANATVANPVCQVVDLESGSAAHSCRPPEWLPGGSLQHLKGYSVSQQYTEHRWKPTMPSSLVVQFWMFSPDTASKLWDLEMLHVSESDKSKWLLDSSLHIDRSLRNSEMAEDVEHNEIMGHACNV